jgi:hypothetical protein
MSKAEKRKIIAKLMKTPEGRSEIAANLQEPLREFRDYETVGRRAFMVDQLPDGALPYYDKDPKLKAYTVGEEGTDITEVIKGDRVFVPLREIATNPMIPLTQIKARKYDVESRVQTKAKSEMFKEEDEMIFNMFEHITSDADAINVPIAVTSAAATIDHFSDAIGQIEEHGNVRCANIFMNAANMKIIRRLGKDYFEPATTSELLKTGQMGSLYNATIHTSPLVSKNRVYFTAEAEFFGVFVESIELTVLPADDNKNRQVGWSIFEQVGALVHNNKGISVLHIG